MKKLLTVVLCIAVIFTFSFSGAFAARTTSSAYDPSTAELNIDNAIDQIEKADVDGVWINGSGDVKLGNASASGYYKVTAKVLKDHRDDLIDLSEDYYKFCEEKGWGGCYIGEDKNYDGTVDTGRDIANVLATIQYATVSGNSWYGWTENTDFCRDLVADQFDLDKAEAVSILENVSLSDFSAKEMSKTCGHATKCESYKAHVENLVQDYIDVLNSYKTTEDTIIGTYRVTEDIDTNGIKGAKGVLDTDEGYLNLKYIIDAYLVLPYGSSISTVAIVAEEGNATTGQAYGTYKINTNCQDPYHGDYASTKKLDDYTKDGIANSDATEAADKAVLKAQVARAYANYVKANGSTKEKDYATDVKEALEYLIDEDVVVDGTAVTKVSNVSEELGTLLNKFYDASSGYDSQYEAYMTGSTGATKPESTSKAATLADTLKDDAARLGAEVNSSDSHVRDADDVADALEEGLTEIYAQGLGISRTAASNYLTGKAYNSVATAQGAYNVAYSQINNLTTNLDDARLAYYKKAAAQWIADDYADAQSGDLKYSGDTDARSYYAAELEEIKGYVDTYTAKVEAATKHGTVEKAYSDFVKDVKKVDTKTEVKAKIDSTKLMTWAKDYAGILNSKLKNGNKYYLGTGNSTQQYEKLTKEVYDLVGASTARTTTAIEDMDDEVIDLIKTFPTEDAVDDAKDALDDAYDALPKTITATSGEAIDAVISALDNYQALSKDDSDAGYKYRDVKAKVDNYARAYNKTLEDKYDALSANDKSGLEAIKQEIKDFVNKYEDYGTHVSKDSTVSGAIFGTLYDNINADLNKIQKDAAENVKTLINKIPAKANLTEASKPVIEAARKAYDAYIEEYTDYGDRTFDWDSTKTPAKGNADGFAADDLEGYYETLSAAETLVGLNATTPEEAVKTLKITAKSVAKKGSITVTWKVVGDESAADGYQIWKSTKHSKGYKKAFTTAKKSYKNTKGLKKGVRYYYKVRAYKVVDGKNVYSDWSNKARRIAK